MGMDLSPSQLVTQSTHTQPNGDVQYSDLHSIALQNQNVNNVLQPVTPHQPPVLQPVPSVGSKGAPSLMSASAMPPPANATQVISTLNPSLGPAINPSVLLLPLTGQNMASDSLNDSYPSGTSSPSSGSRPQTSTAARQRTAQACEKCRDRKTKCSGERPICKRCSDRGLSCVWALDTRLRGPTSTRQLRQTRLESGDNIGEPLSALPVPLFEPTSPGSSPLFTGHGSLRSAPATLTSFPPMSLPDPLLMGGSHRRRHNGLPQPSTISKGTSALFVMGEPIRPLCSIDDCWSSVDNAKFEAPERDRSGTIRARERSNSVSVAHLARSRDLNDIGQTVNDMQASGLPGYKFDGMPHFSYSSGESSNESSPPPLGEFQPTSSSEASDSEPMFSVPEFNHSFAEDQELHQPFPSYDPGSQLSDDMAKLLHFPSAPEEPISVHGFNLFHPSNANSEAPSADLIAPFVPAQHEIKGNTDELLAQYFTADAFDNMQVTV